MARLCSLGTLILAFVFGPEWVRAQEPPVSAGAPKKSGAESQEKKPESYLRIVRDKAGNPRALQTAVTRFVPETGDGEDGNDLVVDLIGVIHFGERDYYRELDRSFRAYDALLYELVAPEGHLVPRKGTESGNPLALFQKLSQSMLGLTAQLDHIDYGRKNFVHADLTPKGMLAALEKRGEDGLTLALGVAADLLRQANLDARKGTTEAVTGPDSIAQILEPGGVTAMKRSFAAELVRQSGAGGGMGRTLGTILIEDRNKAALRVLQKQLVRGKKHIGIFYGAAHMADFETRLTRDFGLKRESTRWHDAWDLRKSKASPVQSLMRALLDEALRDIRPEAGAGAAEERPKKARIAPGSRSRRRRSLD